MTAIPPAAVPQRRLVLAGILLVVAGCTGSGTTDPPSPTEVATTSTASSAATPEPLPSEPSGPSGSPSPAGTIALPSPGARVVPSPSGSPGSTPPSSDPTATAHPTAPPTSRPSSATTPVPVPTGGATTPGADPSAPERSLEVVAPADGGTVEAPVQVEVEVAGFELVELGGQVRPDHGHLFAFVDHEPPAERVRFPAAEYIETSAEPTIDLGELAPGRHTVTVVATHAYPMPFEPRISDTVTFTVAG